MITGMDPSPSTQIRNDWLRPSFDMSPATACPSMRRMAEFRLMVNRLLKAGISIKFTECSSSE